MKLIVGLGNPGNEYIYTRHNIGFLAIAKLVDKFNLAKPKNVFNTLI
jgi:peptidyl-tRNA hydrolase, PTH1 family